jgi:hypothetical protein
MAGSDSTLTTAPRAPAAPAGRVDTSRDPDRGYGWVVFAGSMLMLVGTVNLIYGIAAISNSKFYVGNASYVIGDLNTWGWVMVCLGAIQLLASLGLFTGNQLARWLGILSAGANAVVQMLAISGAPFLALTLFTVDILVLYGLIAYGYKRTQSL